MQREGVLVDTSVWIEYFNTLSATANEIEQLIRERRVWGNGIIIVELLFGARTDKEAGSILASINAIPFLDTTKEIWFKAAELGFKLKRKGITIPLSDLVIATCAIEHNLMLFTFDKHFKNIPELTLYKD